MKNVNSVELILNKSCFLISLDVYSVFLDLFLLILRGKGFESSKKTDIRCRLVFCDIRCTRYSSYYWFFMLTIFENK